MAENQCPQPLSRDELVRIIQHHGEQCASIVDDLEGIVKFYDQVIRNRAEIGLKDPEVEDMLTIKGNIWHAIRMLAGVDYQKR